MLIYSMIAGLITALFLVIFVIFGIKHFQHRRRVGKEIAGLIQQDQFAYTILDVREEEEFQKNHLASSLNVPFTKARKYLPTENMFERIIVLGPSRRKARIISRDLDQNGYFNVTYFGAFMHWKGPVKTDSEI